MCPVNWSVRRIAAIGAGVAFILVGVTVLHYGTAWGFRNDLLLFVLLAVVIGALLAGPFLDWRQRGAVAIAVVGVVVFMLGIGGRVGCNAMGYPPRADVAWGIHYRWPSMLQFGDYAPSVGYRCGAAVRPVAVLIGFLLSVIGVTGTDLGHD